MRPSSRAWSAVALACLVGCASHPWSQQATFVGAYEMRDDDAWLTVCSSGDRLTIVREGEHAALHDAVAAAPANPHDPMIVSLLGRTRDTKLIVDRVLRAWPEETCLKSGVQTTLDNTYWKLVELDGAPVVVHEGQEREAHLILRVGNDGVSGFGGCNSFHGRYERNGDALHFVGLCSTEMACPSLRDENAFFAVLSRVTHYQVLGESLDLRDESHSIARLRAVYLR